jgi:putative transcriptional regulator
MIKNSLKIYRTLAELTQEQLAERASCTRQTIHSIEKNRYNPSLELALKIAHILNTDINNIFQLDED